MSAVFLQFLRGDRGTMEESIPPLRSWRPGRRKEMFVYSLSSESPPGGQRGRRRDQNGGREAQYRQVLNSSLKSDRHRRARQASAKVAVKKVSFGAAPIADSLKWIARDPARSGGRDALTSDAARSHPHPLCSRAALSETIGAKNNSPRAAS